MSQKQGPRFWSVYIESQNRKAIPVASDIKIFSCALFDTTPQALWATAWTAVSFTASWESHPRQDLCRLPSLRGPPIKGGCDWTEVSL